MTRDEAEAEAIRLGALQPQGMKEGLADNMNRSLNNQRWEHTQRARSRLEAWTAAILRGEDPTRTVG